MTSSAVSFKVMVEPVAMMVAPWPLLIMIPSSEIRNHGAARGLEQNAAGRLRTHVTDYQRVLPCGLNHQSLHLPGGTSRVDAGACSGSKKQPLQIG